MISIEDWRASDGIRLEPNALQAATQASGHAIVTAGPGAGKTELLAQRADFLLRTGVCPYPRRILAISFKLDAARNLRNRVRQRSGPQLAARLDSVTFHAFAKRLIDNYRPSLSGEFELDRDYTVDVRQRIPRRQITFADFLPFAMEILQANGYALGGVRQTYSHVFLDEFQDATRDQYELIQFAFATSGASITAVGDTKQRIMAWAGALDGVMAIAAEDLEAERLNLYQNFRSAPRLRRMQNRMIAQMDPGSEAPDEDLVGDGGVIDVMRFSDDVAEAVGVADLIDRWLKEGVAPEQIVVLVRQQPHLVAAPVLSELARRSVPTRNDADTQDLFAEPIVALVFDFLRVVLADRQSQAYGNLMRVVAERGGNDDAVLRFDRELKRFLQETRAQVKRDGGDSIGWRELVLQFLLLIGYPTLVGMSTTYQQGERLSELIRAAIDTFEEALEKVGDAHSALRTLSDTDLVRVMTIHKSKGMEFDKVVVLGVEHELFWGKPAASMSEFFVASSRAKAELVLTTVRRRERPAGASGRWDVDRREQTEFTAFAEGD